MTIWRIWLCSKCKSQLSVNYHATEDDYHRFKDCICGGTFEWIRDEEETERQ